MQSPSNSKTPFTLCPHCAKSHDRLSAVVEKGKEPTWPVDGDATVCLSCGRWAIYDHTAFGGLRKPNAEEKRKLRKDKLTSTIRRAWHQGVGFPRHLDKKLGS